jgi:hypothetical protein
MDYLLGIGLWLSDMDDMPESREMAVLVRPHGPVGYVD